MDSVSEIVMLGELLRTQAINPFYADQTTRLVHALFRDLIHAATGMRPDCELAGNAKRFNREAFYRLAGYDVVSTENWLRIVSGRFREEAADYFAQCFAGALVISHEAGSLVRVMERRNIPFVDMRVSPIRFMKDIYFAFRTNLPEVAARLRAHMLGEDAIRDAADRLRAYYAARPRDPALRFAPGSLLICGQTDTDLSLVVDGGITDFSRHAETLRRLTDRHDHVYYKPHPMAAQACDNRWLLSSFPEMKPARGNMYRMLCDGNLRTVAALSSGVLHEAPCFGKEAVPVSHLHMNLARTGMPAAPGEYVMIGDACYASDFWRDILEPCIGAKGSGRIGFTGGDNFLRGYMGMWWDYEIGRPKPSAALRLYRRLANLIDPRHRLRQRIDPGGRLRGGIKRLLGK